MSNVELRGLEELNRKLLELGQVGREMKKEVLMKAAEHAKDKIKENSPDEKPSEIKTAENEKYGTLKDNINVRWKGGRAEVHTGKAYWAIFLEYGYPGYSPQPFMENTFRAERDEIENIIKREASKRLGLS